MSKKTKLLEKECYEWRVKFEKSNRAVLEMATDKQIQDQYVAKASRQIAQLQKLCRTLQVFFLFFIFNLDFNSENSLNQAERTTLIDALKINNIERPPMPELPPLPTDIEPPPKSADKLDIMSRNCAELKKSLAQLQGQMNSLTAEKVATKTDEKVVNGSKKAKSKKLKTKTCPIRDRSQSLGLKNINEDKSTVEVTDTDQQLTNTSVEINGANGDVDSTVTNNDLVAEETVNLSTECSDNIQTVSDLSTPQIELNQIEQKSELPIDSVNVVENNITAEVSNPYYDISVIVHVNFIFLI